MTVDGCEELSDTKVQTAGGSEETAECVCKRCNYHWTSRLPAGERPKACPDCKSRSWDLIER